MSWARREQHVPRAWRVDSLLAWITGIAVSGLESPLHFSISGVTAVDSLAVAMAVYVMLHLSFSRRGKVA